MVAIVTRAGKGSPLTNAEVDANFVNLNNGKLETSNNLSDLADASAARTNLGLGSLATLNSITSLMVTGALGYTPVNKAGDTITGALSIQGDIGSSTGLVIYNTTTTDGRSVAEFRNDRNSVQRYLLGVDPDGGSNKAFALRDVTGGGIRLWVTTQGNVNVGATHVNNSAVNINKLATGSATLNGFGTEQAVQSDVSTFRGYNTALATQATAFTLGSLIHYRASQGTFGAGSTVTSQNGFVADSSMIGAGTNIGFRGAIPAGSNRWNLYMDGTADNHIAGRVGIGTLTPTVDLEVSDGTFRNQMRVHRVNGSGDTTMGALLFAGNNTSGALIDYAVAEGYAVVATAGSEQGAWRVSVRNGGTLNEAYRVGPLGQFGIAGANYGSAGQVLTSGGAGAAPTWSNPTGGVTSIVAGTGLSGGTITSTGTIALANTAVTAGSYTNASITVDAQGRITSASSGSGGGVTSFNTRTGAVTLSSGDVTGALGFTPYNSSNPSGYINSSSNIGRITTGGIDYGSYGSIGISGSTNSYAGISFSAVSGTLMMQSAASGFYYGNSTWRVYWDGSGNQINTGNVTAYSSDMRLKKNQRRIENPLGILRAISGVYFDWDLEECGKWDFHPPEHDAGLLAQQVQAVYPYAVFPAPFDHDPLNGNKSRSGKNYLTVQYEKVVPVLVEAIKALEERLDQITMKD